MDKINPENETLHKFPCEFSIKVFGIASDNFELDVFAIIRGHVSDLKENSIRSRLSKDKKYQALTITFNANSKQQLDDIYRALSASKQVLMAL